MANPELIHPNVPIAGPPAPAPLPGSLADETGYLLRRAFVYAGEWAVVALPDGVPFRHYEVLQSLADLGPRSQHQLSELLSVNRTIMVKLIDALEQDGLVERRRDPADRRSYALKLTTAGRAALNELAALVDRAEAGFTQPLTGAERSVLNAALRKIAAGWHQPSELPEGLGRRIVFLISAAHHRVRDCINEPLQALQLTTTLYGVLATIATVGPSSQKAIADQLGLTGPAILQTVDRLQALELVERRRSPTDRRSYALEPTPRGHEILRQVRTVVAQLNQELDDLLGGPEQRHELNRLLRALLHGD